jgi:SnoaL-like domain
MDADTVRRTRTDWSASRREGREEDQTMGFARPADIENRAAEIAARLDCAEVLIAFCGRVDRGDRVGDLFTANCEVDLGIGPVLRGPAAVDAALAARIAARRRRTLHTVTNTRVAVSGPDTARASSVVVAYVLPDPGAEGDRAPQRISELTDEFSRAPDGRWLIAVRRTTALLAPT